MAEQVLMNIDLSATRRKQFTINNDPNTILELDTSDFGIISRFSEGYEKLKVLEQKFSNLAIKVDSDEDLVASGKSFKEIDTEMREIIDYIFDSNVCDICAPHGSMYDPFNGQMRYEHIINALSSLYEENIKAETKKVEKRISKHTDKYTKKGV